MEIKVKIGFIEGYYKTETKSPLVVESCNHVHSEKKIKGELWTISRHGRSNGEVHITQKKMGIEDDS